MIDFGKYIAEKDWIELVKEIKEKVAKNNTFLPTVIAEKDGEVLCIVIASDANKNLAFKAASILRTGTGADTIVLALDAYIKKFDDKDKMGNIKQGDLQKAFLAGDKDSITECLFCYRVTENGKAAFKSLPYKNEDGKIVWLKEELMDKNPIFEGVVNDMLKAIMLEKPFLNSPTLKEIGMEYEDDRRLFYIYRSIFNILHHERYIIIDNISVKHPEWLDVEKKAEELVLNAAEKGLIPQICVIPLLKVIEENVGTEKFKDVITEVFEKWEEKFSEEFYEALKAENKTIKDAAYAFSLMVHEYIFAFVNNIPKKFRPKLQNFPIRVKVWNGDQSEYLGEGNYINNVTVYIKRTEDGLISYENAEEKQDGFEEIISNPKIVLDSGKTVYGVSVWFEPIIELKENTNWPTHNKGWNHVRNSFEQSTESQD